MTTRRDFLTGTAGCSAALVLDPGLAFLASVPPLAAPLRVGLVGCGRQGRAILGELAKFEEVSVVGLCDVDPSRLSGGLRRVQGAEGYATHAELLDKAQPDAIIVSTPTHLHREPSVDALAAGVHVYCEAPLTNSVEDGQAIAAAVSGTDRIFQTGMQGRSNPIYGLARSFVRSGAIRDVLSMRAQWHSKTSWRTPASDPAREKALNWKLDPEVSLGLVGEMGAQQFDVLHWFTGRYPERVRANGAVLAWDDGREVADTVHCELAFPRGVRAHFEATLGNSFEGTHELFVGTMGAVKLAWNAGWLFKEADAPTQGWEVYANRQRFHDDEGITLIADATKLAAQGKLTDGVGLPHPPLYFALKDFLVSVTEDAEVACGAEEGLRAAAVAIAAARAMKSGNEETIELPGAGEDR